MAVQIQDFDPIPPNWQDLKLPDTWPDQIDFGSPKDFLGFLRSIVGKRRRVVVPPDLPGLERIPKYALQEFHSLPNGNYSNSITKGYIKGFDIMMLGAMDASRARLATFLSRQPSVLDVGCAGGKTAAAIKHAGVGDVWGIDVSPYLLQAAAREYPQIRFVQASAEDTGFSDQRFDGIAACFLFHEIPPKYASLALKEFHRILKPGGRLAIAEPSPLQLEESNPITLMRVGGLRALYYRVLAQFVHEPFVKAWHQTNITSWLEQHGFRLIKDEVGVPIREIYAEKYVN